MRKDLSVARVRRLASEYDRRVRRASQNFIDESELGLSVSLPAELRPQMACPQLALFNFGLERPHERVAFRIAHIIRMTIEHELERLDLLAHEFFDPVELLLELRLSFKIPTHDDCPPCRALSRRRIRLGLTRGLSPMRGVFTRARRRRAR